MRHFHKRITTLITIIVLFSLLSLGAVHQPGEASAASSISQTKVSADLPGGGEISARSSSPTWLAATKPWTKERMLAAKPYLLDEQRTATTLSADLLETSGEPGYIPSSLPPGSEIGNVTSENSDFKSSSSSITASDPYSYVPPYTSFKNFDSYQRFPYSTVGVLFFSQDGVDYHCTAASIGFDAIWTAGSCIHQGDGSADSWSNDVVFVPAYKNGTEPFGQWTAYNLWTKGQWYFNADPSYDMGGAKLNLNSSGKTISQVVGSLGFAYNLSEFQAWFNVGYPDDPPQWQHICAASYAYSDTDQNIPYPIAMGCDMDNGSTGSPWIMSFSGSSGNANFLNGNSSYQKIGEPEAMLSPYFGEAAKSLWDKMMGQMYLPVIIK